MSVVRLPRLEEEYKVKEGSELVLPCVRGEAGVSAEWRRGGESVRGGRDIILDTETGGLMILSMSEDMEGEYSCRVVISDNGEERVIRTQVRTVLKEFKEHFDPCGWTDTDFHTLSSCRS